MATLKTLDQKNKASGNFEIDEKTIFKYFDKDKLLNNSNLTLLKDYFSNFYDFCFELSPDNMVREAGNFNYGST